jgi:glutathione S-transferase
LLVARCTEKTTSGQPRLRYFDCRSRGQALRFALATAGQPFHDERIPVAELSAFRERKPDPSVGGPFGMLPVLCWDGHAVAETLAISGYLAERLGESRTTTPEERARRAMLTSAAHLEMQTPYSGLLWLPADTDDDQLAAVARDLLARVTRQAELLERSLAGAAVRSGPLIGGVEPCVADAFVFESLDRGAAVFGTAFSAGLGPHLTGLRDAMLAWPLCVPFIRPR